MNTVALEGVLIWAIFRGGIGHFMTELSPAEVQTAFKAIPAAYVTWTLGTTTFKLSVLCLYIRLFPTKTFKILSCALMGLTVAYCLSFLVVFLTTCSPDISQLWNPRPDGYCRDLNIGQLGSVSTNLGLDLLLVILPIPFLWALKMSLRNKITVSVVFSLGFMSVAPPPAAVHPPGPVLRSIQVKLTTPTSTIAIMIWRIYDLVTGKKGDFVQQMPTLALTTTLELWLCIIIACIPTMAPVLKAYVKPRLTKLSFRSASAGARQPGPLSSVVTFGRLGGSRQKAGMYSHMTSGSQEPIGDNQAGRHYMAPYMAPDDAFTTHITSDRRVGDTELNMPPPRDAWQAIHVKREFNMWQAPQRN